MSHECCCPFTLAQALEPEAGVVIEGEGVGVSSIPQGPGMMLEHFQKIDWLTGAVDEVFYTWTVRGCERLKSVPSIKLLLKCIQCLFAFLGKGLGFGALAACWARLTDGINEWVAEFEAVAQLDLKMPLGVWDVCRTKYTYHQNLQSQTLSLQWQLSSHLEQELARAMILRKYRNHLLDVLEWANQIAEKQRVIIQEGELSKNLQALEDLKKIWRLLIEEEKKLSQELKWCPVQS